MEGMIGWKAHRINHQDMSSTGEEVDSLSSLPKELLSNILSLMPIKFDYWGLFPPDSIVPLWISKAIRSPSSVNLPNLKTLDVVLDSKTSDNVFKFINGCPILEHLSLEIRRREDEEDYKINIPNLKRLKLTIMQSLSNINKVFLNVPNLEYLNLDVALCSLYVIEDLSSLVEARVSCEVDDEHLLVELLKGISKAEPLSLAIYVCFFLENLGSSALFFVQFRF
ncbi:FBD-like protein [Tanacetum coccineum]